MFCPDTVSLLVFCSPWLSLVSCWCYSLKSTLVQLSCSVADALLSVSEIAQSTSWGLRPRSSLSPQFLLLWLCAQERNPYCPAVCSGTGEMAKRKLLGLGLSFISYYFAFQTYHYLFSLLTSLEGKIYKDQLN